jgi:hypothetical protein
VVFPQGFLVMGDKIEPLLGFLYRNVHLDRTLVRNLLYQVFRGGSALSNKA